MPIIVELLLQFKVLSPTLVFIKVLNEKKSLLKNKRIVSEPSRQCLLVLLNALQGSCSHGLTCGSSYWGMGKKGSGKFHTTLNIYV